MMNKSIEGPRVRVCATRIGYYLLQRRYPGDVFDLEPVERPIGIFDKTPAKPDAVKGDLLFGVTKGEILLQQIRNHPGTTEAEASKLYPREVVPAEAQFSSRWMEKVAAETPERMTTAGQSLERKRQEIRNSRAA